MHANWEAIGAIGEVAGAVAVIVTLAYLAVQIRANTAASKAEGVRSHRAAATSMNVALAQDGELARIFNTGMADLSKLNAEERTRFAFLVGGMLANVAYKYDEVALGILTEADFEFERGLITPYLTAPGGRAFWEQVKGLFPARFRDYVAREILRG